MTEKTQLRVREIHRRVRLKQARRETRFLSGLSTLCLFLLAEIRLLLHQVQSPGIAGVANGYGSVLLREGTGAYIVVAIAAFLLGATVTILCFRWKRKHPELMDDQEGTL